MGKFLSGNNVKGALLTLLGGTCWGLSGSMGQYLFQHEGMDSRWLVTVRLGLAGILLLLYCLLRYGGGQVIAPWRTRRNRRDLVVYGLAGVSCCQFLYFLTIQLSSAGAATILQDLSPIMILLVGCCRAHRRPRTLEILAIVLALLGVFFLVTHGRFSDMAVPLSALVTGVLSAVCVTIYNVTPGRLMRQFPVVLMQGWAFVMGSAAFFLIFRPYTYHYVPDAMGIIGILFVVLVGNVIAFPAYIQGVKYIGPEKGILFGFSEPVTAAIVGMVLLGNAFTAWDLAGFCCVFATLVLISAAG